MSPAKQYQAATATRVERCQTVPLVLAVIRDGIITLSRFTGLGTLTHHEVPSRFPRGFTSLWQRYPVGDHITHDVGGRLQFELIKHAAAIRTYSFRAQVQFGCDPAVPLAGRERMHH